MVLQCYTKMDENGQLRSVKRFLLSYSVNKSINICLFQQINVVEI